MFDRASLNFALFAGLAGFALAAFAPALLNDSDTYWHIRAGEWMLAHGEVLRADPFSYTALGKPWHTQEWLAEILMALAWRGGWPGVHLLFAVASGLTAGIVAWHLRRRLDVVPAVLAAALGLACVSGSLLARPHLLTLPLLAVWTAGLVSAREKERPPSWWLLLVMPLWANLHGSFAFGLALAGALGIEAVVQATDRRRAMLSWGAFLAAATGACLLTPFRLEGLLFPFRLTAMQSMAHIGEWAPTSFAAPSPFAVALLFSLFLFARGKVRVPPLRLFLLLGLTWMALSHSRHQMLLGITAPLLLAPSLAQSWPVRSLPAKPAVTLLAVLLFCLAAGARLILPAARGDDAVTPAAALAQVPKSVRVLPVLNDYAFGGYLIWRGVRPFIDSRADLYGDAFVARYAALTAPDAGALASALAAHNIRWTIFSPRAPLVQLLDGLPGWRRLHADSLAVVHVRD
jgi:hypothetical protein